MLHALGVRAAGLWGCAQNGPLNDVVIGIGGIGVVDRVGKGWGFERAGDDPNALEGAYFTYKELEALRAQHLAEARHAAPRPRSRASVASGKA